MKVKELFSDQTKWTQGAYAKSKNGTHLFSCDPTAVCFCLYGAISRCYEGDQDHFLTVSNKVRKAIGINDIFTWNDDPNRIFQEVKDLVEKLDI